MQSKKLSFLIVIICVLISGCTDKSKEKQSQKDFYRNVTYLIDMKYEEQESVVS